MLLSPKGIILTRKLRRHFFLPLIAVLSIFVDATFAAKLPATTASMPLAVNSFIPARVTFDFVELTTFQDLYYHRTNYPQQAVIVAE